MVIVGISYENAFSCSAYVPETDTESAVLSFLKKKNITMEHFDEMLIIDGKNVSCFNESYRC